MAVDNFDIIKPLLKFESEYDFYFLQVIQRKKDHTPETKLRSNNNNRLIKAYYIYSIEQLERYKTEIVELCTLFNARAGIGLNKRNAKIISLEMMALLAENIKNNHFTQLGSIYNTVCGQHFVSKDKCWILDVDGIDGYTGFTTVELDDYLKEQQPEGNKILAYIPSKSGYHAIVKPFNPTNFSLHPKYAWIEIHKNNPTNIYIP